MKMEREGKGWTKGLLFAVLFAALAVLTNAQQVVVNPDMNGCVPPDFFLTDWSGSTAGGFNPPLSSQRSINFALDGGPLPDECYAEVLTNNNLFPVLDLSGVSSYPATFTFAGWFACIDFTFSATCSFSLQINGGALIPVGSVPGTIPSTLVLFSVTNVVLNSPSDVLAIIPDVSSIASGIITQATLTFMGSVNGDPHLRGWNGQAFDFVGAPNKAYNLVSDKDLQVNTLLSLQRVGINSFIPGPVMNVVSFLTSNHTIIANAGGSSIKDAGFISIDGTKLSDGSKIVVDNISVSFRTTRLEERLFEPGTNDHIAAIANILIEESYAFDVFFIENGRDHLLPDRWLTKFARRFLDINASLLDMRRSPHGILGQTAHLLPQDKGRSIKDWKMEGNESDYELLDGVLGKDFTFNRFVQDSN